jgi:uncharacterized protein YcgL (UPF0745 family)
VTTFYILIIILQSQRLFQSFLYIKSRTKFDVKKSELIHKHFIDEPDIYFKALGVWTNWDDFLDVKIY